MKTGQRNGSYLSGLCIVYKVIISVMNVKKISTFIALYVHITKTEP
jgi:hypothetical protein